MSVASMPIMTPRSARSTSSLSSSKSPRNKIPQSFDGGPPSWREVPLSREQTFSREPTCSREPSMQCLREQSHTSSQDLYRLAREQSQTSQITPPAENQRHGGIYDNPYALRDEARPHAGYPMAAPAPPRKSPRERSADPGGAGLKWGCRLGGAVGGQPAKLAGIDEAQLRRIFREEMMEIIFKVAPPAEPRCPPSLREPALREAPINDSTLSDTGAAVFLQRGATLSQKYTPDDMSGQAAHVAIDV